MKIEEKNKNVREIWKQVDREVEEKMQKKGMDE
jgi:hypothetical protein